MSLTKLLLAIPLAVTACLAQEGAPTVDPLSNKESIIARAEHSEQLQAIAQRVPIQWPGLSVDATSSNAVEDNAFGDGDLIGVYFAIRGAEPGSSVSLWYEDGSSETAPLHSALTVVTRIEGAGAVHTMVEVDGSVEYAQSHPDRSPTWAGPGLSTCLRACSGAIGGREAFCRSLPPGWIRPLCWAAIYGGYGLCAGFCWARF